MKRLVYITIIATALCAASCTHDSAENKSTSNDTIIDSLLQATPDDGIEEVTGIVEDGARRSIDLRVGDEVKNFELESSEDVSYEIGDKLTIRYIPRETGDSVVEIIAN